MNKAIILAVMIIGSAIGISLVMNTDIYKDTIDCKAYMLAHSNLTAGQGQIYYVKDGRCYEEFKGSWFHTGWDVSMNEVQKNE